MIPIEDLTDVTPAIEDTDEHDEHDLYIIGAVCLSQKSLFPYSKDLVVSHVYSYIPYSKELVVSMFLDTFRTQRNWPFPCFLTLLYSKFIHNRSCLCVCLSRKGTTFRT